MAARQQSSSINPPGLGASRAASMASFGSDKSLKQWKAQSRPQSVHSQGMAEEHDGDDPDRDDADDDDAQSKRRRVQRACDMCRRKKIRCDGMQPEKGACTNCATYGQECTFMDAVKRRPPPRSYVDALEARMERMERLLETLAPGVDFTDRIGPPVRLPGEDDKDTSGGQTQDTPSSSSASALKSSSAQNNIQQRVKEESEDEEDIAFILDKGRRATLQNDLSRSEVENGHDTPTSSSRMPSEAYPSPHPTTVSSEGPEEGRQITQNFIGMASDLHLVTMLERMTMGARDGSRLGGNGDPSAVPFPSLDQAASKKYFHMDDALDDADMEKLLANLPWPESDLEDKLLDAYFDTCHLELPVLNEVQFRYECKHRPELRKDPEWASLAFSFFALASSFIDDPRVRDKELEPGSDTRYSSGRRFWIARKDVFRGINYYAVSMHFMQGIVVGVIFLLCKSASITIPWVFLSVAVRSLQDIGAHRKATAKQMGHNALIEETYRRLWWVCYTLDRDMSAGLGRPLLIHDEDFDVDPPSSLDDRAIYDAAMEGKSLFELPGRTSDFAAFVCQTHLDQIVGRTLRTIYAIGKAKIKRGLAGSQWDLLIITEIDSALNQWLDTVPANLRYNPNEPDDKTLYLSSLLYARYYQTQILVHRPFLPSPRSRGRVNFPSLAICTNAARSMSHLLYNLHKRNLLIKYGVNLPFRAFTAGCVLLIVMWGAKKSGGSISRSALSDVQKCIVVLDSCERINEITLVFKGCLETLLEASDLASSTEPERTTKRGLDGAAPKNPNASSVDEASGMPVAAEASSMSKPTAAAMRKVAGSRAGRRPIRTSESSQAVLSSLPLSTTELVRAFTSSNSNSSQTASDGRASAPHSPPQANDRGAGNQSTPSGVFQDPVLAQQAGTSWNLGGVGGAVPSQAQDARGQMYGGNLPSEFGAGTNDFYSSNAESVYASLFSGSSAAQPFLEPGQGNLGGAQLFAGLTPSVADSSNPGLQLGGINLDAALDFGLAGPGSLQRDAFSSAAGGDGVAAGFMAGINPAQPSYRDETAVPTTSQYPLQTPLQQSMRPSAAMGYQQPFYQNPSPHSAAVAAAAAASAAPPPPQPAQMPGQQGVAGQSFGSGAAADHFESLFAQRNLGWESAPEWMERLRRTGGL